MILGQSKTATFGLAKKSRFTAAQIVKVLNDNEAGRKVADIARELGVSVVTFYSWPKKYAGMEASNLKRLKDFEAENAKLKAMYAESQLDIRALKDALGTKW